MASKGKGKGKVKLGKKQFKVGSKIIDLERFAYDVFVHSAKKFGVEEPCISRWEGEENDYGLPDFILVLSRFLFRFQITERNDCYIEFKRHYESTEFKSFETIKTSLQEVLYKKAIFADDYLLYELMFTLSVICELILFLYANNCELYLTNLSKFWFEYWCYRKKDVEKAGGLADLYRTFNHSKEYLIDVFYNGFIPAHCIPYKESVTLKEVFNKEFRKFFKITEDVFEMQKKVLDEGMDFKQLLLGLPCGTPAHPGASGIVYTSDAVAPPRDVPSTSRQTTAQESRGSSKLKEGRRKKNDLRSVIKDLQKSHPGILGTEAATSAQNLASTSRQGAERDQRGSSNQKKGQKKTGSLADKKDLEHTGLLGAETATSSKVFPTKTRQRTEYRKISPNRKQRQMKVIESISDFDDDLEELHAAIFGTTASTSSKEIPSKIHQGTETDRKVSPTQKKGRGKKISSRSGLQDLKQLHAGLLKSEAATSSRVIPSKIRQGTEKDSKVSPNQREEQITVIETLSDFDNDLEELHAAIFGTEAATASKKITSKIRQGTETDRQVSPHQKKGKGKKIVLPSGTEDLKQLHTGLLGAEAATSSKAIPSKISQGTHKVSKVSPNQKKGQGKKIASPSGTEDLKQLHTGLLGAEAATSSKAVPSKISQGTDKDSKGSPNQKKGQRTKTGPRSSKDCLKQLLSAGVSGAAAPASSLKVTPSKTRKEIEMASRDSSISKLERLKYRSFLFEEEYDWLYKHMSGDCTAPPAQNRPSVSPQGSPCQKLPEENLAKIGKQTSDGNWINQPSLQDSSATETSETQASPQNIPSTSYQRITKDCKASSSRKERLRKKTSSREESSKKPSDEKKK